MRGQWIRNTSGVTGTFGGQKPLSMWVTEACAPCCCARSHQSKDDSRRGTETITSVAYGQTTTTNKRTIPYLSKKNTNRDLTKDILVKRRKKKKSDSSAPYRHCRPAAHYHWTRRRVAAPSSPSRPPTSLRRRSGLQPHYRQ